MSITLRNDGDRKHFEVGEPLCGHSALPVESCMHCQLRPAPVLKDIITCTDIDHERGVITFTATARWKR